MLHSFDDIDFQWIPRSKNTRAYFLSQLITVEAIDMTRSTYLEVLDILSLDKAKTIMVIVIEPSWMDPLIIYFTNGHFLEDEMEAQQLVKKIFSLCLA